MTQLSEKDAQIYAQFRNESNVLAHGEPLKLNSNYIIRVWLDGLEPDSIWVGKALTITLFSGDRVVKLEKRSDSMVVSTLNTRGLEPVEFTDFSFEVGSNLSQKDIVIFYVDVIYGFKVLTRVTCIREVEP